MPLRVPAATPASSPAATDSGMPAPEWSIQAMTIPVRDTADPADRSITPEAMINVIPAAIIRRYPQESAILTRLEGVRKNSLFTLRKPPITTMTKSRNSYWLFFSIYLFIVPAPFPFLQFGRAVSGGCFPQWKKYLQSAPCPVRRCGRRCQTPGKDYG